MNRVRSTAVRLFLLVAIGIAMALAAPFGSAVFPPAARFLYWVGFMLAGWIVFVPVAKVGTWLTQETRVPRWLAVALTAMVGALPLAWFIALSLQRIAGGVDWLGTAFPLLYLEVAALALVIQLVMLAAFAAPAPAAAAAREAAAEGDTPRDAPFLRRLPPGAGDLLCLEMQDHYVKAHTAAGGTMILMRFRDAVAELDDAGLQVHRSWWVAHGAVAAVEREGRLTRLRLTNGMSVPVSRAALPGVRAAGWDRAAA
jgi:hypothetical protein